MRLNAFTQELEAAGCVAVADRMPNAGEYRKVVNRARRPYGSTVIYYQRPDADKAYEATFGWNEEFRGERERN